MPYKAEISRTNPTCFLFLIDQSGSMGDFLGAGSEKSKAEHVADAINRLLQSIVLRCAKDFAGGIRDYFHIGVIGYESKVGSILGKPVSSEMGMEMGMIGDPGRTPTLLEEAANASHLVPISIVANNPIRVEERTKHVDDGAGSVMTQTIKFPVWFDPVATGETLMCQALDLAWQVVNDFLLRFPGCYPPLVINITDGEASDGDPEEHAKCLRDLASTDGSVLVFNCHVSSRQEKPVEFPDKEGGLPDEYARLLFRMSSPLPPTIMSSARRSGYAVGELSRGFVFNADLVSLIRFLDIGTKVDDKNLR